MTKFPVILLDVDDTLFDFKMAEQSAIKETFDTFQIEPSDENIMLYSSINRKYWNKFDLGLITKERLLVERFEELLSMLKKDGDPELINKTYLSNLSKYSYIIPGADKFCEMLSKNHRLYIVTNGTVKAQVNRLKNAPFTKYITEVFISEKLGYQKPQKEYFDFVFNKIGLKNKEDAIILGDSITSDIKGGKNAGIATCLFDPLNEKDHSLCDFVISSYDEFFDIVD